MPDAGAAGIPTASENQVIALQKRLPGLKIDISAAGQHCVRFVDHPDAASLGTVNVKPPFGTIHFATIPANIPFLLCLSDIDRYKVCLNNIENVLVHELRNIELSAKSELRQLYRRFGHPAVERLYRVLTRAGYDDLDKEAIEKITKYCHQCQIHGGAPGRFCFTLHDNFEFNYRSMIDIMYINGKPVLHAVDEATESQVARFLTNMTAKATWDTLRVMLMDMYVRPPDAVVTDAGTNLTAMEFCANAYAMAFKVEEILLLPKLLLKNLFIWWRFHRAKYK
ncbi:hypothetical protein K3495_g1656 [Podosphaera aphanis]|nr:hypothetical protein K3495_g1656 [Podosphaera aphanis]